MTKDEQQKVYDAISPFNEFVREVVKNADWHDKRNALLQQMLQRIATLVVEEEKPKEEE